MRPTSPTSTWTTITSHPSPSLAAFRISSKANEFTSGNPGTSPPAIPPEPGEGVPVPAMSTPVFLFIVLLLIARSHSLGEISVRLNEGPVHIGFISLSSWGLRSSFFRRRELLRPIPALPPGNLWMRTLFRKYREWVRRCLPRNGVNPPILT